MTSPLCHWVFLCCRSSTSSPGPSFPCRASLLDVSPGRELRLAATSPSLWPTPPCRTTAPTPAPSGTPPTCTARPRRTRCSPSPPKVRTMLFDLHFIFLRLLLVRTDSRLRTSRLTKLTQQTEPLTLLVHVVVFSL